MGMAMQVLIGDEMGLGKTVQACALAKCYQDDWPALIVTPSSMR
jgi:SWI/SNF-related matrix-associated actin-dependent regulator 1 of chromatin subfamily A